MILLTCFESGASIMVNPCLVKKAQRYQNDYLLTEWTDLIVSGGGSPDFIVKVKETPKEVYEIIKERGQNERREIYSRKQRHNT